MSKGTQSMPSLYVAVSSSQSFQSRQGVDTVSGPADVTIVGGVVRFQRNDREDLQAGSNQ